MKMKAFFTLCTGLTVLQVLNVPTKVSAGVINARAIAGKGGTATEWPKDPVSGMPDPNATHMRTTFPEGDSIMEPVSQVFGSPTERKKLQQLQRQEAQQKLQRQQSQQKLQRQQSQQNQMDDSPSMRRTMSKQSQNNPEKSIKSLLGSIFGGFMKRIRGDSSHY